MRMRSFLTVIAFCMMTSLWGTLNNTPGIWLQTNDSAALVLDLSDTYANPNSTDWYYYGKTYIGKIGSNFIGEEVQYTISCNNTSDQTDNGNFCLRSVQYPDAYRTFRVGRVTRVAVGPLGGGDSHKSLSNTVNETASKLAAVTLPACNTTMANGLAYYFEGSGYVSGSENMNNQRYHHVWDDFIIIMDAPSSDAAHLKQVSDYQAILTITVTSPAEYAQTLTIPLMGYYESEPVNSGARYECTIGSNNRVLDLTSGSNDAGKDITVGNIHFLAQKSNSNANNALQTDFQIVVSASSSYNDTSSFRLRKQSSRSTGDSAFNSLPFTLGMMPAKPTLVVSSQETGTTFSQSAGNGGSILSTTSTTGILPYFSHAGTQGDGEAVVQWNYDAPITVNFAASDTKSLVSGNYACDIYFFIISNA